MDNVDEQLARIGVWAWKRHGDETRLSNEEGSPLERIKREGAAQAFQEAAKYILLVREARTS